MENFIFALSATVPVFLVMALGFLLQKARLLNDAFNQTANEFVFRCALPISLFRSMAGMDLYNDFKPGFCLFCVLCTTAMFFGIWAAAWAVMKDKSQVGAFTQASARSNTAILGIAIAVGIYGDAGVLPMVILSTVPFVNVYSVLILSFSPQVDTLGHLLPASHGRKAVKKACVNVAKNPLILSILVGLPFSLFQIQLPTMLDSALSSIGAMATPMALLVIGASFSGNEAMTRWKGAVASSFVKLFLLPAMILPLAAILGYRQRELLAILIMTGAPTAVSSFVMAKNMRADSVLTANVILLSTLLSSVSITLWLYLLRVFQLI